MEPELVCLVQDIARCSRTVWIYIVRSAYTWFIELTIVVLLIAGEADLNPEPQMQQMME